MNRNPNSLRSLLCTAIALLAFAALGKCVQPEVKLIDPAVSWSESAGKYQLQAQVGTGDLPDATKQVEIDFTFQYLDGEKWKDAKKPGKVQFITAGTGDPKRATAKTDHFPFEPAVGQQWRVQVNGHYRDDNNKKHPFANTVTSSPLTPRR